MNSRDLVKEVAGRENRLKGEVVLLIGPPSAEETAANTSWDDIRARAAELLRGGMARSAVVKQLTVEFDAPRNALYRVVHRMKV